MYYQRRWRDTPRTDVTALISRFERRQLVGKVAALARSLADALDPLHRQLTANVRDRGSTRLSVLITLQTFPVASGAHPAANPLAVERTCSVGGRFRDDTGIREVFCRVFRL